MGGGKVLPKGKQTLNSLFFADNSKTPEQGSREGDASWVTWKTKRKMSGTLEETAAGS